MDATHKTVAWVTLALVFGAYVSIELCRRQNLALLTEAENRAIQAEKNEREYRDKYFELLEESFQKVYPRAKQ